MVKPDHEAARRWAQMTIDKYGDAPRYSAGGVEANVASAYIEARAFIRSIASRAMHSELGGVACQCAGCKAGRFLASTETGPTDD